MKLSAFCIRDHYRPPANKRRGPALESDDYDSERYEAAVDAIVETKMKKRK
jgi:hypothetical protein